MDKKTKRLSMRDSWAGPVNNSSACFPYTAVYHAVHVSRAGAYARAGAGASASALTDVLDDACCAHQIVAEVHCGVVSGKKSFSHALFFSDKLHCLTVPPLTAPRARAASFSPSCGMYFVLVCGC